MKHFLGQWKKIKRTVRNKHVYLFLDFDGTLAPIRKDPVKVKLAAATVSALKALKTAPGVSVAVVTGRKLSDIKKLVGVKGLVYAGNHGLEAEGPSVRWSAPESKKTRKVVKTLERELKKKLRPFKGVIIEDKGLTLSVHFRMAKANELKKIDKIVKDVTAGDIKRKNIVRTSGKKVWEVRPPIAWNKGKIVAYLLGKEKQFIKRKITPFYIGDDKTDEDAFRHIKNKGFAIKVGNNKTKTAADYYVKNISEVRKVLKLINNM